MKRPQTDPPQVMRVTFDDMESFTTAYGWDLDFRQLSPGRTAIESSFLANSNVSLARVSFKQSIHQRGIAPEGTLTFGMPLAGNLDWYGGSTEKAAIMNFNHRSGFDTVSTSDFAAYTFSFHEDFFLSAARDLGVSIPDYIFRPPTGSILKKSQSASHVRQMLDDMVGNQCRFLDGELETEFVTGFLDAAMESAGYGYIAPLHVRSRALFSAIEFVEDNRYEALTVRDICKNTNIPVRTLNRAFKERFGVSPKAYIRIRRLAGVNKALLTDGRGRPISDIANEWDFWHMGQFARDYRSLYGELPSDTSRRSLVTF